MLDANDGKLIWSRNAVSDTKAKESGWGFTGYPVVMDDKLLSQLPESLQLMTLLPENHSGSGLTGEEATVHHI